MPPPTELILLRHGETDSNVAKRYQGHLDTPLNAAGRRQAARVAARLGSFRIDALYSSDLQRAFETARIIGSALGLEPQSHRELREIDVGAAVGKTRAELREVFPDLFGEAWTRTPFPGGESYDQMADRLVAAIRKLIQLHPGRTLVVVTHGGAVRAAVARLTGIELQKLVGLAVKNTSLTHLTSSDGISARLRSLNDAAHLEPWAACLE